MVVGMSESTPNTTAPNTNLSFTVTPNENRTSSADIAKVLENPGFGVHFTDHMVLIDYDEEIGWHNARVEPYGPLTMDPASMVFHYGQAIFEGIKAYRQPDGSIATFRPEQNAQRMARSAERLGMAPLPEELFIESLQQLVAIDHEWVPAAGGEAALYLRPLMIARDVHLGVQPSKTYTYMVIASPAGAYFTGGIKPVSVWLSTEYVRAAPGGTGAAKCAGNYAGSLMAQAQAAEQGCDQVVWLDAVERKWVEEMGGMNLMFVFGEGENAEVITPELSGSLLPGVTRDSLIQVAKDLGYNVNERRISIEEWEQAANSGMLSEVLACGTAAVVTPVGSVKYAGGGYEINGAQTGEVTMRLRDHLTGIQRGAVEDKHGWLHTLVPAEDLQ